MGGADSKYPDSGSTPAGKEVEAWHSEKPVVGDRREEKDGREEEEEIPREVKEGEDYVCARG